MNMRMCSPCACMCVRPAMELFVQLYIMINELQFKKFSFEKGLTEGDVRKVEVFAP